MIAKSVATVDVLVAGAGPAGAAAAITAARRGLEVALIDRAHFPRDKPCGEGLLPSATQALERLGLWARARALGEPISAIRFSVAGGPSAEAPVEALGVERRRLDSLLLDTARRQPGVTVLEGVEARAPLVDARGSVIGLETSLGPVRARAVVCADGLRSSLREQLGLQIDARRRGRDRLGLRAHYRVRSLPFGRRVQVILDGEFEYYLTPVGAERLQVAVLGRRAAFTRAELNARSFAEHVRLHLGQGLDHPDDRPLGAGPFVQRARRVITDGALLCGDAAGYVDAITGEGVGLALQSGLAAGETLADALAGGAATRRRLAPYAEAHHRIVRDSERLTRLTLFLAEHPRLLRRAVGVLQSRPELFARLLAVQAGAPFDRGLRAETYLRIMISR